MNEQPTQPSQPSVSPRSRLKELLSIPERQRTDAQWDELNELEIALASANRAETPDQGVRRNAPAPDGRSKPGGGGQGKFRSKSATRSPPKKAHVKGERT